MARSVSFTLMSARPQEFVDEFGRRVRVMRRGTMYVARFANHHGKAAFGPDPETAFFRLVMDTPPGWKPGKLPTELRMKKEETDETAA